MEVHVRRALRALVAGVVLASTVLTPFAQAWALQTPAEQEAAAVSCRPVSDGNELRMWYAAPGSPSDWENSALVIGNGKTGAILFGQVESDQLHFNEKTLWTGGPSEGRPGYDGGNRDKAVTKQELDALRARMDDHSREVFPMGTNKPAEVWGDGNGMGAYQDFGDLHFDFSAMGVTGGAAENYVRDLDMQTAVSTVAYDHQGVHYEREYFASRPAGVVAARFTSSDRGKISFTLTADAAKGVQARATSDDDDLVLAGQVADNGMLCEMRARVVPEGGAITASEDGSIRVSGADAVTVLYATETDYENEYPAYRSGQTAEQIDAVLVEKLDAAAGAPYERLREEHIEDYRALFGRVQLDLGGSCAQKPTDQMMKDYRAGKSDRVVEEMLFQFGRYLTIASSREGDELPSNLCGIWMMGDAGRFWGGDFHFNVNVQMNYWPAYMTNLAECGSVFTDYLESLVVPGRVTAERSAAMKTEDHAGTPIGQGRGFLVNTQNNPFGCTAPFGSQEYGWNVTGSSWALQNAYDEYLYTRDTELLRTRVYPMLKEMTTFWDGFLWKSDYQKRLVVGPSFSAEQGPTVNGSTYDQSLVWELYTMAIDASEELGVDEGQRAAWKKTRDSLNPIIIGSEGQVKEWFEETTTGKAQAGSLAEVTIPNFGAGGGANQGTLHRHTSQLIGLYPGTLINKDNRAWMDAAIKTLEIRGLGGTGWSKAHKINMWARTGNAETTYSLIRAMIAGNKSGILDNLLDSHPPFQIDGNFGLTAGMTECLLQSQLGYAQLLPALPKAWDYGSVRGIVARGNYVVDMDWSAGTLDQLRVESRSGGTFTAEYRGLEGCDVIDGSGNKVAVEKVAEDRIAFETQKGGVYTIKLPATADKLRVSAYPEQGVVSPDTLVALRGPATAEIRYTLDGSDPTAASPLYSGPIALQADRVSIRAAVFEGEKRLGDIQSFSYVVVSDDKNVAPLAKDVIEDNHYHNEPAWSGRKAVDGDAATRWATNDGTNTAVLELVFDGSRTIHAAAVQQYYLADKNDVASFTVDYWDDETNSWVPAAEEAGLDGGETKELAFDKPATSARWRLNIVEGVNPSIWEFKLYETNSAPEPAVDKSKLQDKYDEVKDLKADGYKTMSWKPFARALEDARAVLADAKADQSAVDAALKALLDAEAGLEKVERVVFVDVDAGTAHAKDIAWLAANGITKGWAVGNGTFEFRPYATVRRADMAAFLYRLAGEPEFDAKGVSFTDVDESTPHYKAILWLAAEGVSTGWEAADGTAEFRPYAEISRCDMAAFLYRMAGKPKFETEKSFADVARDTPHREAVLWLAETGVSEGWTLEDGTAEFRPYELIARCDMAAFLQRMAEKDLVDLK